MLNRRHQHPWDVSPARAREIQAELRSFAIRDDEHGPIRTVAGVDVAFPKSGGMTRGAAVLLDASTLEPIEFATSSVPTRFPYVPGLLSFREVPALFAALERLSARPDLIVCDGQGFAHPRRFGLACHLGVLTDCPTIGVAKTRLLGSHGAVPDARGGTTPLLDGAETIGAVVRTRPGVRPVFVSTGHRVSLESAVALTMSLVTRYRLPETTRIADRLSKAP